MSRVSRTCLQRGETIPGTPRYQSVLSQLIARWPRNLLMDQYDVDSSGAVLAREYFIR
jgi:hypothetical protein